MEYIICDSFIENENVLKQQNDTAGNIIFLAKEEDVYVVSFVKAIFVDFEEYEYEATLIGTFLNNEEAVKEYENVLKFWNNPTVHSINSYK